MIFQAPDLRASVIAVSLVVFAGVAHATPVAAPASFHAPVSALSPVTTPHMPPTVPHLMAASPVTTPPMPPTVPHLLAASPVTTPPMPPTVPHLLAASPVTTPPMPPTVPHPGIRAA